jgi:hypothetical protein
MNISNPIREDGDLFALLGKMILVNSKRNGTFWSEDFDDLKKSLKSFGRRHRRSAIDIT